MACLQVLLPPGPPFSFSVSLAVTLLSLISLVIQSEKVMLTRPSGP